MSQEVLAGLVGRTGDWLGRDENNRIRLDRLSVIRQLADVLGVTLGDLLDEQKPQDLATGSNRSMVPALRAVLTDYPRLTPLLDESRQEVHSPPLSEIERELRSVFDAYQASRLIFAASRAPLLLTDALLATKYHTGDQLARANEILALSYQAAASVLTKLGEPALAWMAAERGLAAAQGTESNATIGSLIRSVAFSLLSTGELDSAMKLANSGAIFLQPYLNDRGGDLISAYGTLLLVGGMAASRLGNRSTTETFLVEATEAARRLGADHNHLWTAFGPTNVAIHQVNTAMELGDVQVALDLGPTLDTRTLPTERRVRHLLDVTRAYHLSGHRDKALTTIFQAEKLAPEQVHRHYISKGLVTIWIRATHGRPGIELDRLGRHMRIIGQGT